MTRRRRQNKLMLSTFLHFPLVVFLITLTTFRCVDATLTLLNDGIQYQSSIKNIYDAEIEINEDLYDINPIVRLQFPPTNSAITACDAWENPPNIFETERIAIIAKGSGCSIQQKSRVVNFLLVIER